jgi:hypothetical protein
VVAISASPSTRWRGTPATPRGSSYWFFGLLNRGLLIVRLRAFVRGFLGTFLVGGLVLGFLSCVAFFLVVFVLGFLGFAAFLLFVLVLGFFGFAAFLLFVLVLGLLRSTIVCGLIGSRLTCLPVWRTFS